MVNNMKLMKNDEKNVEIFPDKIYYTLSEKCKSKILMKITEIT